MANTQDISFEDKFSFDLNGFIILRNVLSKEEIESLNKGIDSYEGSCQERGEGLRNTQHGTSFEGDGKTGFIIIIIIVIIIIIITIFYFIDCYSSIFIILSSNSILFHSFP